MKLATWNINSVRIRLRIIQKLIEETQPDILCLQETKVEDRSFPLEEVRRLGYEHIYISGQKSYNGVAILSHVKLRDIRTQGFVFDTEKRHIAATLPDGTELHNFYVPAGGDIPDPAQNPKFDFKLKFMEAITQWFAERPDKARPAILVGDLNIAPLPTDVWSHKQLLTVVSHTPVEVAAMEKLQASLDWVDTVRHFTPAEQKLYSWWSYRNRDWEKSDRGRRLDHIWVTPHLKSALKSASPLKAARNWDTPSDHVPVLLELDVAA